MGVKHIALAFKSTVFVLLAFAIVLFVRLAWMEWNEGFTMQFLRTGRIGELVLLFLLGAVITIVFTKLLQFEFRAETRHLRKPAIKMRRR